MLVTFLPIFVADTKIIYDCDFVAPFIFMVNGSISISAFAQLVGIPIGIASSAVGLKIWVITVGIRKYNFQ